MFVTTLVGCAVTSGSWMSSLSNSRTTAVLAMSRSRRRWRDARQMLLDHPLPQRPTPGRVPTAPDGLAFEQERQSLDLEVRLSGPEEDEAELSAVSEGGTRCKHAETPDRRRDRRPGPQRQPEGLTTGRPSPRDPQSSGSTARTMPDGGFMTGWASSTAGRIALSSPTHWRAPAGNTFA